MESAATICDVRFCCSVYRFRPFVGLVGLSVGPFVRWPGSPLVRWSIWSPRVRGGRLSCVSPPVQRIRFCGFSSRAMESAATTKATRRMVSDHCPKLTVQRREERRIDGIMTGRSSDDRGELSITRLQPTTTTASAPLGLFRNRERKLRSGIDPNSNNRNGKLDRICPVVGSVRIACGMKGCLRSPGGLLQSFLAPLLSSNVHGNANPHDDLAANVPKRVRVRLDKTGGPVSPALPPLEAVEAAAGKDGFDGLPSPLTVLRITRVLQQGVVYDLSGTEAIQILIRPVPDLNPPSPIISKTGNGKIVEQAPKSLFRDAIHLLNLHVLDLITPITQ